MKYNQLSITFDAGLFVLLGLKGTSPATTLIIFQDQLTKAQLRQLLLITKNSKKPKKSKFKN